MSPLTPDETRQKIEELRKRLNELAIRAENDMSLVSKVIELEEEIKALEAAQKVRTKLLKG